MTFVVFAVRRGLDGRRSGDAPSSLGRAGGPGHGAGPGRGLPGARRTGAMSLMAT